MSFILTIFYILYFNFPWHNITNQPGGTLLTSPSSHRDSLSQQPHPSGNPPQPSQRSPAQHTPEAPQWFPLSPMLLPSCCVLSLVMPPILISLTCCIDVRSSWVCQFEHFFFISAFWFFPVSCFVSRSWVGLAPWSFRSLLDLHLPLRSSFVPYVWDSVWSRCLWHRAFRPDFSLNRTPGIGWTQDFNWKGQAGPHIQPHNVNDQTREMYSNVDLNTKD